MPLLKPEASMSVGLATAVLVYATYQVTLPNVADVRVSGQQDPDIDSARKVATWTGAGIVSAISLVAKDPTVFVIGGATVVALDVMYRHADAVHPALKKVATSSTGIHAVPEDEDAAYGEAV